MGQHPSHAIPQIALKYLNRSALVFLFDLLCAVSAWACAFWIRVPLEDWAAYGQTFALALLWLLPCHALACRWAGLYRGLWAFASLPDLKRLLRAIGASAMGVVGFIIIVAPDPAVPRALIVLFPMFLVVFMGGGRALYRIWKERVLYSESRGQGKPVVVVGAGRAAAMLLRELAHSRDWRVVALLDDDPGKWGRDIDGCRVVGPIAALGEVARAARAHHAILAFPSDQKAVRRVVTELAVEAGVQVMTVPRIEDLMAGVVTVSHIRKVEIEDLLGRDPVWIDTPHVESMLKGRAVLVTGAGGSIGSELCRQLVRFSPSVLVLVEQSEFALYQIEKWFADHCPETAVCSLVADVKDRDHMFEIFRSKRPDVVFHAAAYKHVPLMEVGNAWQAVRNNVLGTYVLCSAAREFGVDRFVMISTDKAVNPTNVMGATKRLAEMVCQAMQAGGSGTQFEMVRFGNVLGSTGSVIPRFQEQIACGGPVTVTHPEITRYFMSIHEAVQLVLQAATMGRGGEIFVMEMGEPVRIEELARNMIRLSGYAEDEIRIEYTGLRPGEKLYEELLADSEETRETPHPKLRIARAMVQDPALMAELLPWLLQTHPVSDDEVRKHLARWVPEYQPPPRRPALSVVDGGVAVRA